MGKDPEIRQAGETKVAKFSVAVTEKYKGEEQTEWVNVVFFGKIADVCEKYLKKGSKVMVEGKLKTSSWDDKTSGQKRYNTEVIGQNMEMLGGRDSAPSSAPQPASSQPDFSAPPAPEDSLPF